MEVTATTAADTYDVIQLADGEYGNDTMRTVAADYFARHPAVAFVEVREHAGWYLGYRRDLTLWSTANDCARFETPSPQPACYSGRTTRRTTSEVF